MFDSDLMAVLGDISKFVKVQKQFDNLTTEKFNEIIDLVNSLEEKVKNLEEKVKYLEDLYYNKN